MKNIDIKSYKLRVTSKYSVIASAPPLNFHSKGETSEANFPFKGVRGMFWIASG